MKTTKYLIHLFYVLRRGALGLVCLTGPLASAQTLWTGPSTNFVQCLPDCEDQIIPTVALNRNATAPLFNSAPPYNETFANGTTSPEDTLWAFGTANTINQATNLSYQTFAAVRDSAGTDLQAFITNKPMVLQLINEQIYIPIEFTAWGRRGAAGFAYTRSTAPAAPPPPVVLSSPGITNGVFAFTYNVTPGLTYVVQSSSNLTTWLPVTTNIPSSSPALFTNALVPNTMRYFRVDRVSSP